MFISQCMRLCVREFIKCVSSYLSDRKWTQYFSLEDHLTDQWCYSFPPTSHSVHSLSLSLSDQIFLSFKHTHTHRTSSNAFYFFKQLSFLSVSVTIDQRGRKSSSHEPYQPAYRGLLFGPWSLACLKFWPTGHKFYFNRTAER